MSPTSLGTTRTKSRMASPKSLSSSRNARPTVPSLATEPVFHHGSAARGLSSTQLKRPRTRSPTSAQRVRREKAALRDSRELPRKLRPDLLATAPTGNRRQNGLRLRPMRRRQVV